MYRGPGRGSFPHENEIMHLRRVSFSFFWFHNSILSRLDDNDRRPGFRLDGFSRLTRSQSGVLFSAFVYFIRPSMMPFSDTPAAGFPHMCVAFSPLGEFDVSGILGFALCHMRHFYLLCTSFFPGARMYATDCHYGAIGALNFYELAG